MADGMRLTKLRLERGWTQKLIHDFKAKYPDPEVCALKIDEHIAKKKLQAQAKAACVDDDVIVSEAIELPIVTSGKSRAQFAIFPSKDGSGYIVRGRTATWEKALKVKEFIDRL